MQCDYLLEFVTAVNEGSITKAAAKLGFSQPSLSRHIKTLETELGIQLIHRSAGGVELTPDGRRVYAMASPILDAVDNIEQYAESCRSKKSPTMCGLSDYPTLSHQLFSAYAKLGRRGSLSTVHIDSLEAESPCAALESGEIVLWVTYSNDSLLAHDIDESLCVAELFHPRVIAIMETSNPLAAKGKLFAKDLDGQMFYKSESNYMRANTSWKATKEIFAEHGVRYHTITGSFEHESDWFADFGLGILPMAEGNRSIDLLRSFGKVALPVEDLAFTFVGVYRKGDRLAERLIEECKDKQVESAQDGAATKP